MLYQESSNGQSATLTGFQDNQMAWFLDLLYSLNQHNQAIISMLIRLDFNEYGNKGKVFTNTINLKS